MAARIRRGDTVLVISGVNKGRRGEVTRVVPSDNRAFVAGINMATHHIKPSRTGEDGRIERREAAIHLSNLALIDPKTNEKTKVGFRVLENGNKVRIARKTGEVIES